MKKTRAGPVIGLLACRAHSGPMARDRGRAAALARFGQPNRAPPTWPGSHESGEGRAERGRPQRNKRSTRSRRCWVLLGGSWLWVREESSQGAKRGVVIIRIGQ